MSTRSILLLFLPLLFSSSLLSQPGGTFNHPGILHSDSALRRMKEKCGEKLEPWMQGYKALQNNPRASFRYKTQGPFDKISRDPSRHLNDKPFNNDCTAAYYNALMWNITGDKRHARKTIDILNAWSITLKAIIPRDAELLAGLNGALFVNAAEIIRYSPAGWAQEDIERCEMMLKHVIYPVIKDFAGFANGNWGNACMKTVMAIGVFCNDTAIFNSGVRYYYYGEKNASLPNYIVTEEGQCQESGRDQAHSQLGLGNLAECAETGYNQGLDMYGAMDNKLLKGFEYTAAYNLGKEVPYQPMWDKNNKYRFKTISEEGRGNFRPVFEMIYNHYVIRKGLTAPHTTEVIKQMRPETDGPRPADQPGFGTLTFSIRPD